jgi:hypothetical protein
MGVFRRRYPDGRVSKDWYINYRVNGHNSNAALGQIRSLPSRYSWTLK